MLIISSINREVDSRSSVRVDNYVPLAFRSYSGLLGARYLRLGNFKTSLLELLLDPESATVRGMTLTSFDMVHSPSEITVSRQDEGLPILDMQRSRLVDLGDGRSLQCDSCHFTVGIAGDFIELDLFGISSANSLVRYDSASFYLKDDELVGIRITGLQHDQIAMLREHMKAHAS